MMMTAGTLLGTGRKILLVFLTALAIDVESAAGDSIIFAGSGGCDEDDPTCVTPPEGTDTIYTLAFDGALNLTSIGSFSGIIQEPGWLLGHTTEEYDVLYVTETGASNVWALQVEPGGTPTHPHPKLKPLGHSILVGEAPVHLSLDAAGLFLFVANYMEGSLAAISINPFNGSLETLTSKVFHHGSGPDPTRQGASHVHGTFVSSSPACRKDAGSRDTGKSLVYAMDLGLDRIFWYEFDPTTGLLVNGTGGAVDEYTGGSSNYAWVPSLSGPRHMVLQPLDSGAMVAHVICELSSTIVSFSVDATTGALTDIMGVVSTLPEGSDTSTLTKAAEILLSDGSMDAEGKLFIYASNRGLGIGSDSIAVFAADTTTGALNSIQFVGSGGVFPRGMTFITSNSAALALSIVVGGRDSNSIAVFPVDRSTGFIGDEPTALATGISTPVAFYWSS